MAGTRGTQVLKRAGVPFELHEYDHVVKGADFAAEALGIEPERMAKSLVVDVDGSHVFALVPAGRTLSLRELARVASGRAASLATERDAERLTGYLVGGISPFGARRPLPVYAEEAWVAHERVALNAGRRGAIVELASADLRRLLEPVVAVISTPV
jgi:Cys-tRNA(Pro)/Cys-tRNA(Cys) deacylase